MARSPPPHRRRGSSRPRSHLLSLTKQRVLSASKLTTDSSHAFAQPVHVTFSRRTSRRWSSSGPTRPLLAVVSAPASSIAKSAQPIAPMRCACAGRTASTPHSSSKARSTASDRKVPPWTTTRWPGCGMRSSPMMRCRAFLTTEYATPAAMSSIGAPAFCACLTREFMKTVHLVPRSMGWRASRASSANCHGVVLSAAAVPSMNAPHPLEHASLSAASVTMPCRTHSAFMS